jgi:uncharacterized membrane protein
MARAIDHRKVKIEIQFIILERTINVEKRSSPHSVEKNALLFFFTFPVT